MTFFSFKAPPGLWPYFKCAYVFLIVNLIFGTLRAHLGLQDKKKYSIYLLWTKEDTLLKNIDICLTRDLTVWGYHRYIRVSYITANLSGKLRNLPYTDVRNYSKGLW